MARPRPKDPPTPAEKALLALVLREVRHAKSTGEQLSIVVDHWLTGDGVHVSFTFCGVGYSAEVQGKMLVRAKKTRRPG